MSETALRPAIFLDRDGTLNVEKNYLHTWEQWEWLPGVCEGLRALKQAGFLLVVVTNQSGVARGYYEEEQLHSLHMRVNDDLAARDVAIDAFYHCPHHPDFTGACDCRKPEPGMLLRAANDLNIDLRRSWLVGDTCNDILAGLRAGCRCLLVLSGYGISQRDLLPNNILICRNFTDAVEYVLGECPAKGKHPPYDMY